MNAPAIAAGGPGDRARAARRRDRRLRDPRDGRPRGRGEDPGAAAARAAARRAVARPPTARRARGARPLIHPDHDAWRAGVPKDRDRLARRPGSGSGPASEARQGARGAARRDGRLEEAGRRRRRRARSGRGWSGSWPRSRGPRRTRGWPPAGSASRSAWPGSPGCRARSPPRSTSTAARSPDVAAARGLHAVVRPAPGPGPRLLPALARGARRPKRRSPTCEAVARHDAGDSSKAAGSALAACTIADAIEEASGREPRLIRNRLAAGEQLAELDQHASRGSTARWPTACEASSCPVRLADRPSAPCSSIGAGMLLSGLLLPATVTGSLAYALAALGLAGTGVGLGGHLVARPRPPPVRLEAARRAARDGAEAAGRTARPMRRCSTGAIHRPSCRRDVARAAGRPRPGRGRSAGGTRRPRRLDARARRPRDGRPSRRWPGRSSARKAARGRWRAALAQRGLPTTLSPRDVRQIAPHRHALLTLDDDRRRLSEEARHKREELAALRRADRGA